MRAVLFAVSTVVAIGFAGSAVAADYSKYVAKFIGMTCVQGQYKISFRADPYPGKRNPSERANSLYMRAGKEGVVVFTAPWVLDNSQVDGSHQKLTIDPGSGILTWTGGNGVDVYFQCPIGKLAAR